MRKLQFVLPLLLLFALPAIAQSKERNPVGNWSAIESLPAGTPISVKAGHPFRLMCFFERANESELSCQPLRRAQPLVFRRPYPRPFPPPFPPQRTEYVFERQEIQEVRIEHNTGTNELLGVLTVGGAGAAIGAAAGGGNSGISRPAGALLLGGIGALFGGVFGRDFPLFHRKVIYRR